MFLFMGRLFSSGKGLFYFGLCNQNAVFLFGFAPWNSVTEKNNRNTAFHRVIHRVSQRKTIRLVIPKYYWLSKMREEMNAVKMNLNHKKPGSKTVDFV